MKFFTKMRARYFIVFTIFGLGFSACQKNPGTGGNSTVKGSILVKDYNGSQTILQGTYPGVGENVFIIYGTETNAPSDKVEAGTDGTYEFKFLAKGKYKIYALSAQPNTVSKSDTAIIQTIEIIKRRSEVIVPEIVIKK